MKKIGVIWVYLFAAVISVAVLALDLMLNQAMAMSGPSDREKALERQEKKECDSAVSHVIVEIGNLILRVPRYGAYYRTLDNQEESQSLERQCETTRISNLFELTSDRRLGKGFSISLFVPNKSGHLPETTYEFWSKAVNEGLEKGTVKKMSNGTVKISYKGLDRYLLSKERARTKNDEPVLLDCGKSLSSSEEQGFTAYCSTKYLHPDGIMFGYRFWRKEVDEKDYLSFDLQKRKMYEDMKIEDTGTQENKAVK